MIKFLRTSLVVLIGVLVCSILSWEIWSQVGGGIRLYIPLAGAEGLPLPLFYWAGVAVYAWTYGRLFRLSSAKQWRRGVWLGFSLHLLALTAHLAWYVAHDLHVELSRWYLGYWSLVWGSVLAGGIVAGEWWMSRWVRARTADPWLFFLPLIGGYLAVLRSGVDVPRIVVASAVAAGIVGLIARRAGLLSRVGSRLRAWLEDDRVFLALVCGYALAFRLFYASRIIHMPDFLQTGSDGPMYDALAWSLRTGEPLQHGAPWAHSWFSPGYVRFLAGLYWLAGRNYFFVCAVQSVLGALACWLAYDVGRRLFGRAVARITAVFAAANFSMIFAAVAIGHQALDLVLTLLVVWCLLRHLEHPAQGSGRMVLIGLLLGFAAATREGNAVFWLFLVGWWLVMVRWKIGWRLAAVQAAALSLGTVVVLLPFLRGSESGILDRIGWQWFFRQYSSVPINTWFNPWRDPAGAWALFREQPLNVTVKVAEAIVGNFTAMFLNQDYGNFDPIFLVRWSPFFYGMWTYAYGLAFLGAALVLRQAVHAPLERLGWWLIIVLLVSRTLVHLFFEAAYRHRTPLEPYLILLAAYGATRLFSRDFSLTFRPNRLK